MAELLTAPPEAMRLLPCATLPPTLGSYLLEIQPLNEADGRAIEGASCDYEAAALCCTGQAVATCCQLGQRRYFTLKGKCQGFFSLGFIHESSSLRPLKITLGSFTFFSKICRDICKSGCTTDINDNGAKFCHQYR
jgi:hypothetical protein